MHAKAKLLWSFVSIGSTLHFIREYFSERRMFTFIAKNFPFKLIGLSNNSVNVSATFSLANYKGIWRYVLHILCNTNLGFGETPQTWYLSLISLISLVEKNLSCGEISAFHVWQLWGNWKFVHMWRNFRCLHMLCTIDGVLLQFMPFCC